MKHAVTNVASLSGDLHAVHDDHDAPLDSASAGRGISAATQAEGASAAIVGAPVVKDAYEA